MTVTWLLLFIPILTSVQSRIFIDSSHLQHNALILSMTSSLNSSVRLLVIFTDGIVTIGAGIISIGVTVATWSSVGSDDGRGCTINEGWEGEVTGTTVTVDGFFGTGRFESIDTIFLSVLISLTIKSSGL